MIIFISIIIGIVIFYQVIIPFIHNQYYPSTEKRITKGLLSMSFWQIVFGSLVCAYALKVEPVYKQTDEDVSSFVQEYSIVGDLVNEYTGINTTSNFNYLMSEADSLHTFAVIFIIITIVFSLVTVIGCLGRKLDRRIVEGLAILNTLACCWIAKSSTDLYEMIIRDGATLQTIAWIGRLLGTDIYSTMDWIIRIIWLCPLILIIKHYYYHKTLNEYYALVVPQSGCIYQQEKNKAGEQSKPTYIGLAIGSVAFVIIAVFIVYQYTDNEDAMPIPQQAQQEVENSATKHYHTQSTTNTYEQRSNAIIQELTTKYGDQIQVDHKYPELSQYCTFRLKGEDDYGFPYLLIYDLDRKELKQFDTEALPTNNAGEVLLINYDVLINQENNTLLISGNNGANSIGHIEYVLELNPSNWQIRELCSGRAITKNDDGYIAHRMVMTKFIDCNATSEYAFVDIHYDLQGRLIAPSYNGNTYYLKGQINNKYPITMQLSMQGDKIYGKYYYDKNGSDSCLHLYGGVSDSGDVVLLEFNNKGEQTGDFKGRFTSDSFYGTFVNYKGIEMPFELQKDNHNVVPQETTLKKYHNSRFGYNVLYPSSFSNIYESENGDGCRFSKDSHTCLIVYGMHNVLNETIEDKYNEYRSKSPVYYRLKDNWFVVSDYTENGDIFYLKTVLKDGVFITAELHYPNNEKEYYSKLISKIFTNFPN